MKLKILMITIVFAMLAANVSAIGIARGFSTVDFSPNKKIILNYYVYNDEHMDGVVSLSVEGSLADRADVEPKRIKYKANQELIPFTVTFRLPEKKEGDLSVIVQQLPVDGGELTATVRAVHKLQFSERNITEKVPETIFTPTQPEEQEIRLLVVKRQPFINTTTGKAMLLVAILATIANALIYLHYYLKGKGVNMKMPEFKGGQIKSELPTEQYPELTHFLKKGNEHGLNEDVLVEKLTKAGWEKETVEEHIKLLKQDKDHHH